MTILQFSDPCYQNALRKLYFRPACPPEIEQRAAQIVQEVAERGDEAILEQIKKFDGADLTTETLKVSDAEFAQAEKEVSDSVRSAVGLAIKHVTAFAQETLPKSWFKVGENGAGLGEQFNPMECVACYIPGGTAPLASSAIHTVAIAKAAGVKRIIAATPPRKDGTVHPATLYALRQAGADEVYKMGGATAIGALAYGTNTVPRVEKIVGPGNAYVAAAKRLVYGRVGIDMVAGPSEVMVIADETANPEWAAADLLSQAEHGSGLEQAVLVTDSLKQLEAIRAALYRQADTLTRQVPLRKVIENGIYLILCPSMGDACEIASNFAPEHLELLVAEPQKLAKRITAAGAIFLGHWTPEPVGDFTAGPSHVLPTGGTAKFFHGITTSDFIRRTSLLCYGKESLKTDLDALKSFAGMEGLDGHGRSVTIRLDTKQQ